MDTKKKKLENLASIEVYLSRCLSKHERMMFSEKQKLDFDFLHKLKIL